MKTQRHLLTRLSHMFLGGLIFLGVASCAFGNAIFLTGDDPDYHVIGPNNQGATNLLTTGVSFVMNPLLNSFVTQDPKFLFVEGDPSTGDLPVRLTPYIDANGFLTVDNVNGASSLSNGGFTNFDVAYASNLESALGKLGQPGGYSALVIASDFGGILTQAELNILNANSQGIVNFLNNGGGLFAMAESGSYVIDDTRVSGGLTSYGQFGFLPFVTPGYCSNPGAQESGSTLTAFGGSLGLSTSDVNGNYAHNCFSDSYGLNVVNYDSGGKIVTLAGSGYVNSGGVSPVPEPSSIFLLATGLSSLLAASRKRRS